MQSWEVSCIGVLKKRAVLISGCDKIMVSVFRSRLIEAANINDMK